MLLFWLEVAPALQALDGYGADAGGCSASGEPTMSHRGSKALAEYNWALNERRQGHNDARMGMAAIHANQHYQKGYREARKAMMEKLLVSTDRESL
jgi:hypothetical protein